MRGLGTRRAADDALAASPAATRATLEAYARGVNALIASKGRFAAPEYLLFGRPSRWTPSDSLIWAETMGLYLSGNMNEELARLRLTNHLSRAGILALWPNPGVPGAQSALHVDRPEGSTERLAISTLAAIPSFPDAFTLPATASNAWVVDGRHTRTGAPVLAGDPHLAYGLPALWYLVRIDTPAGTLAGATAPGVPFLVIGRNRSIAWSFTTAGADTEDVYVEHVLDPGHYAGPDGSLPFDHRLERIRVRGRADVLLTVRSTRHGPVLSDLAGTAGIGALPRSDVLSVRIASLLPGNQAAAGLQALDHAGSIADAGRIAPAITAPVQNLVVADRTDIALFTTGRVPRRSGDDGRMPVDGWTRAHDWTGFAEGATLPTIENPPNGIIVNANEPVSGTGSTVMLSGDPYPDWRASRIRSVLSGAGRTVDLDLCSSLQNDVRSDRVRALLPRLRAVQPSDVLSRRALALLDRWDGTMAPDRPEPLIVNAWLAALGAALAARGGDPGQTASLASALVREALLTPGAAACDRTCKDALTTTLARATTQLADRLGPDPASWRWARLHRAHFANPIWENLPVIGSWLGTDPPVGGDDDTVDVQGFVPVGRTPDSLPDFTARHGASFRGIYDLADLDRSRFVLATGESGQPIGRHLLDLQRDWRRGRTVALGAMPDRTTATMVFVPSP